MVLKLDQNTRESITTMVSLGGFLSRKSMACFEDTHDKKWEKQVLLYIALSPIISTKTL